MRVRIAFVAIACLASSAFARRAGATDCSGIFSTCIDDDAFWPHAGRGRFEQIGAGDTVAPRQLGFGLVTSYLSRAIVIKSPSPGGSGSDQFVVNDQVNSTFLWSYGVADRLELDLALPITLGQGGAGLTGFTGGGEVLNDTALRDLRFGFTYSLLRRDPEPESTQWPDPPNGWSLAGRLEVSAPTGDRDQFAGEHAAVFVPGLSGDVRLGRLVIGAEVGARIRPVANLLGARVGTQILTALGASVDILPRQLLSASIEAWALPTLVSQEDAFRSASYVLFTLPNDRVLAPAEWQFSIRSSPLHSDSLSLEAGGGTAIPFSSDAAITSPRFRFVLGIRWAPGAGAPPPPPAPPPPSSSPSPPEGPP
jgi:hypothetical protein